MSKKRETRHVTTDIRAVDTAGKPQIVARVVTYNTVDEYGTTWLPGCFAASLERRMPRLCWGHDWRDPIGVGTSYVDSPDGLDITFDLDDFDAVPRARQAHAQAKSGTIDQFSVGFTREKWTVSTSDDEPWSEAMEQAELDECSMVLVGAVKGTKTLAVRSADGATVDVNRAGEIAVRLASGEIDLADALAELKADASTPDAASAEGGPVETDEERAERETAEQAALAEREAADAEAERAALEVEKRARGTLAGHR